jgi:hypothetical protein
VQQQQGTVQQQQGTVQQQQGTVQQQQGTVQQQATSQQQAAVQQQSMQAHLQVQLPFPTGAGQLKPLQRILFLTPLQLQLPQLRMLLQLVLHCWREHQVLQQRQIQQTPPAGSRFQ